MGLGSPIEQLFGNTSYEFPFIWHLIIPCWWEIVCMVRFFSRIRDTLPCLFCSNSNVSKQQLMRIPETLEFHERWTSEPRFQMEKKHSSLWDWVLYHASWPNVILLYLQGEICTVQELVLPLRPVGSLFPSNYLLL